MSTPSPLRRALSLLLALASIPLLANGAAASPLFELVGSGFGTGGFNARADDASAASTYFHPARLPHAKAGLEIGWFLVNDAISITLDARSPAQDIPVSALERFGTDNPSLPTAWLERGCDPDAGGPCITPLLATPRQSRGTSGKTRLYQTLGLVTHIWPRYFSLGLYAMVPYGPFTQAHSYFVDEREQFFTNSLHAEMYGDRLTPVSLAFGAGSQVLDWLSVGLTFTLSLHNTADAVAYVGNSALISDTLQLSTRIDVGASVSPHASILIEPFDDLDLSLTLHSPQKMVIETTFSTYLPNGDLQRATRPSTHAWLPWILGAGLDYDFYRSERISWTAAATLTFERWSEYQNRQTERPMRDFEFRDIAAGSVGLRFARDNLLRVFVDGSFHPTPVPPQTGRTNYVDNHRVGIAGGASYDIPVTRWNVAFRLAGQLQAHFLTQRHQTKLNPKDPQFAGATYSQLVVDEWPDAAIDISTGQTIAEAQGLQTNNPGWPGFASKGTILAGGLSVSLLY